MYIDTEIAGLSFNNMLIEYRTSSIPLSKVKSETVASYTLQEDGKKSWFDSDLKMDKDGAQISAGTQTLKLLQMDAKDTTRLSFILQDTATNSQ